MNRRIIPVVCLGIIAYIFSLQASAKVSCFPPEGLTPVTSVESTRYLIFGELHGSVEAPALFGESVCAVVTSGKKVLVGLEFPESSAGAFRQFLRSAGGPDDVKRLLVGSSWVQQASRFPDGRTSQATLDLVKQLQVLRASGYGVSVAPFQRSIQGVRASQTPYEKGMAASLMGAESNGSYDLIMVLVGGVHASKAVVGFDPPFEPMAMHLPQNETVTLNMVSQGGTAWSCTPECGVHPLTASATDEIPGIVLGKEMAEGYDGVFNIGTASASPPVTGMP